MDTKYIKANFPLPLAEMQKTSCPLRMCAVHLSWNGSESYNKYGATVRCSFSTWTPSTEYQLYCNRVDQPNGGGISDIMEKQ